MRNWSSRSDFGDDVRVMLPPIDVGSDDSVEESSSEESELASNEIDPPEVGFLVG